MPTKLNFSDLKILESLAKYGPRNISEVARKLGIPPETLHKRVKRLSSKIFLKTHINVYHTNLGLKKAVVFAEAIPGYEDLLFNCLKQNDFWIAIARGYGMFEGCVGVFTVPKDHCLEFEQFLKEIEKLKGAKDIEVFWSTCFHSVYARCNWFNSQTGTWNFQWDKWIDEIKSEHTELPYTLKDPKDFPVLADEIDIFMLKELEKDARTRIAELARMLNISEQLAQYHFHKHLIEKGLIESFQVTAYYFGRVIAYYVFFIFNFESFEKLAKLASSLLDKPFARSIGKILDKNALYGYFYIPMSEFRKLLKNLSKLVKSGFLESYRYVVQDFEDSSRQTISYEYFENGKWIYDHERHVEKLRSLIQEAIKDKSESRKISLKA